MKNAHVIGIVLTLDSNKVGYTRRDYEGRISKLCAGCSHDSISTAIIHAAWEIDIKPHRLAKKSGIGCGSKTPDIFLDASSRPCAEAGRRARSTV